MTKSDAWPDNTREVIFVIVVAGLVFLAAQVVFTEYTGFAWSTISAYQAATHNPANVSGDNLTFSVSDVQYLNRAYDELNTRTGDRVGETAYCLTQGRGGVVEVTRAGTLEAGEGSVTFTTSNCRGNVVGTLHFHPPSSRPVLSEPSTGDNVSDKQSLLESPYRVMCVQSRLVVEEGGVRTENLRCYEQPRSGEVSDVFPEVPVMTKNLGGGTS